MGQVEYEIEKNILPAMADNREFEIKDPKALPS
jgi:hypothetical protein